MHKVAYSNNLYHMSRRWAGCGCKMNPKEQECYGKNSFKLEEKAPFLSVLYQHLLSQSHELQVTFCTLNWRFRVGWNFSPESHQSHFVWVNSGAFVHHFSSVTRDSKVQVITDPWSPKFSHSRHSWVTFMQMLNANLGIS